MNGYLWTDEFGEIFLVMRGERIPVAFTVPFVYQVPVFSNLAAGATSSPNTVLIDASSDFLWEAGVYEFDLAAAAYTYTTRPMPNMSLAINDSASGRNLQNVATPVGAQFGPVEKPMRRVAPYVFRGAATITFVATNFDAAVANGNLRLSLIGQQIYRKG